MACSSVTFPSPRRRCSRHPSSRTHGRSPDAPPLRESGGPEGTRNSPALCAEREQDGARKKWRQGAGSCKKYVRSTPWSCQQLRYSPSRTVPGPRAHSPAEMLPTRHSTALLPAPGCQQRLFLAFLPLDRAKEGVHGGRSLPSLRELPAKKQVLLPSALPGAVRAAPTAGGRLSPPAWAGAFPSRVASQQTCCWPWRGSRAALPCRHYPPSLPQQDLALQRSWKAAHFLPAGGDGCQSQGAAPRQAGEKKTAARLAALGTV